MCYNVKQEYDALPVRAWEGSATTERRKAMPSERESNEVKKSMAYDLIELIDSKPEQETYTAEEIKKLIKNYITMTTQK